MNNLDVFKSTSGFDRHTLYEPHGWPQVYEGKTALKDLKEWAKSKGYTQLTIIHPKKADIVVTL